ncbi:MAG: ABC transporter ATP-binding protein, partial [Actinobacteria bacterium]|nr:ABC transporter ATP-binding protein [Actinomycetota bacterium]
MQTQTDTNSAVSHASEEGWITISHLEKLYQPKRRPSVHALSDINFNVHKGE